MQINTLAERAYVGTLLRGHHWNETAVTGHLARVHTDLGRALDADRRGEENILPPTGEGRPTGPAAHLADAAIRVMTLSHFYALDLEDAARRAIAVPNRIEPAFLGSMEMERMSLQSHPDPDGLPPAKDYSEMTWHGHQVLAESGREAALRLVRLQGFPERPQGQDDEDSREATDNLARIFCWLLAAGHATGVSLSKIIEAIIDHDETRPAAGE